MSSDARHGESGGSGGSGALVGGQLRQSFHRTVGEGTQRLRRTWRTVFVTGIVDELKIVTALRPVRTQEPRKEHHRQVVETSHQPT